MAYRVAMRLLAIWWVVRRPRSRGVRCVLHRGDAVVLVRHTYGDRRWMLPGGRIRRRQDPITTAQREMHQELGVVGRRWQVVGCLWARNGYRRRSSADSFRRHSTFYIKADVTTPKLEPRPGELSNAKWFSTNALPDDRSDSVDVAAHAGFLTGRAEGENAAS